MEKTNGFGRRDRIQESLERVNQAALILQTIHRVIVEIDLNRECECDDFMEIQQGDKAMLMESVPLLGRMVEHETYDLAKHLRFDSPS